jgi:hypothetical protein
MKTAAVMAAATLVVASGILLVACDNGTTTSSQTYSGSKDGSDYVLVVTGSDYELTIKDSNGTHTSTGTVTSGSSGTFVLQPKSGNPITVEITGTGGITGITVPEGSGIVDEKDGSTVTPPDTIIPDNNSGGAKTLVITGLPADWTEVTAMLTDENQDEYPAGGYTAAISGGTATVALKAIDMATEALTNSNWTGTGSWIVYLWDVNYFGGSGVGSPVAATYTPVPFSDAQTSVSYTDDFEDLRGEKIGQISGTVTLTDIPDGAKVYIRTGLDGEETDRYPVTVSGSTGTWTIPLYKNDFPHGPAAVTGPQELPFILLVVLSNGSEYRPERLYKTLDLTDKTDIPAENIGTASLKSVTLSGTITVTHNGQPVYYVEIRVHSTNGNTLGFTGLNSPGAGAPWSVAIAAFDSPTDVVIDVNGYGSGSKDQFHRNSVMTVTGVSSADRPGITLNLGNITGDNDDDDKDDDNDDEEDAAGSLSGTVTFTDKTPAPFQIRIYASYGTGSDRKGIYASNNGQSKIVSIDTGAWSLPYDDAFLAALEDGSETVDFNLSIWPIQGETAFSIEKNITVSKTGLTSIDLGTVSLASARLSGNVTVLKGGASLSRVLIYAIDIQDDTVGVTEFRDSSSAGNQWYMYIPAQGGKTVTFWVYCQDSAYTTLFNSAFAPGSTDSVNTAAINGISLNVGDIDTAGLSAPDGLNASASGNNVTLTWNSAAGATSYNVYRSSSSSGPFTFIDTTSGTSYNDSGLDAGTYYYKVTAYKSANMQESIKRMQSYVPATVTGGGGGGTLSPEIDSSLYGTWKDDMNLLSVTFTGTTVTWGGTLGDAINTATNMYQGTAYSLVWVAGGGSISYKFSYQGGTPTTIPVYGYTISGSQLDLTSGGVTLTLTKQ